jgi:hypothetical protein
VTLRQSLDVPCGFRSRCTPPSALTGARDVPLPRPSVHAHKLLIKNAL